MNFHRSSSDQNFTQINRQLSRLTSNNSATNLTTIQPEITSISWQNLNHWIHSIFVVHFDLRIGHSIEYFLPIQGHLTEKERTELQFLSLPDTNTTHLGDLQYHFRLHRDVSSSIDNYRSYNSSVPAILQVDENSLFGYVNFRQIRDKTSKRGYFQKSLIILSRFPFISLFSTLSFYLSKYYFETGVQTLESCLQSMDNRWTKAEPGKTLLLPLLNKTLQVRIPMQGEKPFSPNDLIQYRSNLHETMSTNEKLKFPLDDDIDFDREESNNTSSVSTTNNNLSILQLIPFVHDVNTYLALSSVLSDIQMLWELVLLNEPIAILGNSPTSCSQTVQALIHTIWPLRYASDYRPFLTIVNAEISTKLTSPVIVGVTNRFFPGLVKQWSHFICLNDKQIESVQKKPTETFLLVEHDEDDLSVNELDESIELSTSPPRRVIDPKKMPTTSKVFNRSEIFSQTKSTNIDINPKAGLYTKYKPYLKYDKYILKKLQSTKSHSRLEAAQNALLRRFFLELTQSFIIPLERYFTSLLPLRKTYQVNNEMPTINEFNEENFLKSLEQNGPQLTSGLKGDWKDLYRHFFSTSNFRLWLSSRQEEAKKKIFAIYFETMANGHLEDDFHISSLNQADAHLLRVKLENLIIRFQSNHDETFQEIDKDSLEKLKLKVERIQEKLKLFLE